MANRVIRNPIDRLEENWELIHNLLKRYAQSLQLTIVVSHGDGGFVKPRSKPGVLYLCLYSVPGDASYVDLSHVYGYELEPDQTYALIPSSIGRNIYDTDQVVVAQVVGGTLYVLFDLLWGDNARILMRRIMDGYIALLEEDSNEDKDRIQSEERAELVAQSKDRLVELLATCEEKIFRDIYTTITDYEESIRLHQQGIFEDLYGRRRKLRELRQLEQLKHPPDADQILSQLKNLSQNGSVIVTNSYVSIDVGQVDIVSGGITYDVGEFDLYLYPSGAHGGVRVVNRTRTVQSRFNTEYFHPHVTADGYCCLGNISDAFSRLLVEDLVMAATLMIKYIKTTNNDDTMCRIDRWPVRSK